MTVSPGKKNLGLVFEGIRKTGRRVADDATAIGIWTTAA